MQNNRQIIHDVQSDFGLVNIKKEEDDSPTTTPTPRCPSTVDEKKAILQLSATTPPPRASSPTLSTASSNDSINSAAMSLTAKNDSTDPTAGTLGHQQDHEHQQQQRQQHPHQQQFLQRHQIPDEEKQRCLARKQLDELHTHRQMTANLFMARTMALSTSRDLPDMLHAAASAGGNYLLPCPLCETPLEPRIFRQHLDRHYPRDSPVCPVMQCGRRFAHPNSVRNHMRIKHTLQWAKMKAMRSSGGPFTGISDYK